MTEEQIEDLFTEMVNTFKKHQTMIMMNAALIAKCSECLFELHKKIDKLESSLAHANN